MFEYLASQRSTWNNFDQILITLIWLILLLIYKTQFYWLRLPHTKKKKIDQPGPTEREFAWEAEAPTYFFGLKIYTLTIFLGQEIYHTFFLGLKVCLT